MGTKKLLFCCPWLLWHLTPWLLPFVRCKNFHFLVYLSIRISDEKYLENRSHSWKNWRSDASTFSRPAPRLFDNQQIIRLRQKYSLCFFNETVGRILVLSNANKSSNISKYDPFFQLFQIIWNFIRFETVGRIESFSITCESFNNSEWYFETIVFACWITNLHHKKDW